LHKRPGQSQNHHRLAHVGIVLHVLDLLARRVAVARTLAMRVNEAQRNRGCYVMEHPQLRQPQHNRGFIIVTAVRDCSHWHLAVLRNHTNSSTVPIGPLFT
jgi:hypothetical protein